MSRKRPPPRCRRCWRTICGGGAHGGCVTAVYAFGSCARGALTVGDAQQVGGALGLAVLTAVAGRTESVAGDAGPATALNEGFQAALLVAAGIVVVAVIVTAFFARGSRPAPAGSSGTDAALASDRA
jgi:hypothetical protein